MGQFRLLEAKVEDEQGFDFSYSHRAHPAYAFSSSSNGIGAVNRFSLSTGTATEAGKPWRAELDYSGRVGSGCHPEGQALQHEYIMHFHVPDGTEITIESDIEGDLERYTQTGAFMLSEVRQEVYSSRLHLPLTTGNVVLVYGVMEQHDGLRPTPLNMWGMPPVQMAEPELIY